MPHQNRDNGFPRIVALDPWDLRYAPSAPNQDPPQPIAADREAVPVPVPSFWDDHTDRLRQAWPDLEWRTNAEHQPIELPMPKSAPDASLPHLVGAARYDCTIDAPDHGRLTFECGPVFLEAWLWVNGQLVHHQPHYSTDWSVPLDKAIVPGKPSQLTLQVANTHPRTKGCSTRGFKGYSAGIAGPARLRTTGPARLADLFLCPTDAGRTVQWHVDIDHLHRDTPVQLNWRLVDPDTGSTVRSGKQTASHGHHTWTCDTDGLEPWSDRSPRLYHAQIELSVDDQTSDARSQPFGLRVIEADGFALRLNGSPLYLRGVTEHAYFPTTCTVPLDKRTYRENIRKVRELGFNWLRFHTWVPPEPYLEAADELGMLVQVEPPRGADDREWTDILRACRRHPSVVIYCAGNEELLDEDMLTQLERWAKLRRDLVPDALFNPQEALRGVEYGWKDADLGDDAVAQPYLHNPRRLERLKTFSDCFGQFSWGWLSYNSSAGDPRQIDQRLAPYQRPCLSHELGIHGTYLDLDLEHRYQGTRIGTDLYAKVRAHLRERGLEHRAADYYDRSCQWARRLRKHAIETARRCSRLAGYDLLGAIDHHWHRTGYPCGAMNEFYQLKPGDSVEDIRQYNDASVLLLDHGGKWTCTAGSSWSAALSASIYETRPVEAATIQWMLRDDGGHIVRRGEWEAASLRHGDLTPLGDINFTAPAVTRAAALTLEVRLVSESLAISNHWPLWVYPAPSFADSDVHWHDELAATWAATSSDATSPASAAADDTPLRVVPHLDESDVDRLEQGERMLLLGPGPFPSKVTLFQIACAGRTEGNLATCLHDHPVTRQLPHRGFCDWNFQPMLNQGEAVQFDDLPTPFDPIVEVVSSFKDARKQAALFELRVGRGRLLVCSLGLSPDDPAAAHLLQQCIRYASSPAFDPAASLEPSLLRQLVHQTPQRQQLDATDQGHDTRATLTTW